MKTAVIIIFIFLVISIFLIGIPLLFVSLPNSLSSPLGLGAAGVYKSSDGGEHWFTRGELEQGGNLNSVEILDIAIDPKDPAILYAGTKSNGLYKSITRGESWIRMTDDTSALGFATLNKVRIGPKDPMTLYLAVSKDKYGYIYKSEDGGHTFTFAYVTNAENQTVTALEVDPLNSKFVYIGTSNNGVLESRDAGDTWQSLRWFQNPVTAIAISKESPPTIYVATAYGFFRTSDRGQTFVDLTRVLTNVSYQAAQVSIIHVDEFNQNVVYLGTRHGLLRTDNSGASFHTLSILVPPDFLPISSIELDPKNRNAIYISAGPQIYKSIDRGENWSVIKLDTQKTIKIVKIDYTDPRNIYLGVAAK